MTGHAAGGGPHAASELPSGGRARGSEDGGRREGDGDGSEHCSVLACAFVVQDLSTQANCMFSECDLNSVFMWPFSFVEMQKEEYDARIFVEDCVAVTSIPLKV